jgi:MATE family multidrug resistance protein
MTADQRETLVFSKGPLRPGGFEELLRLAGPAMASSVSQVLMGFADSVMVAGVERGAVGAVVAAAMMFHVLTAALGGMLSAIVPFTSQSYSRGRPQDGARYTWQGLYLSLAFGALGLAAMPLVAPLFALIGHAQSVQQMEAAYGRYMAATLVFFLVRATCQAFFQGIGRTKLIMVITVTTNALNLLLNWLLIFGVGPFPRMGVAGAGLATMLSSATGAAWFLAAFLLGRAALGMGSRAALAPSWSRMKGLLRIGIPTSWQWSLDVAAWSLWHALMIGRLGAAALDANGAVMEITAIAWFPVVGIGQGACSLVGWYLGRERRDVVRRVVRVGMTLSAAYMVIMALGMFFGARGLMKFFFQLQKAGDGAGGAAEAARLAEVIALGAAAIRIAATFQLFDGWNITLMGALRGGGDTLWPAVVSQGLTWLLFLPLAWLLCFPLGLGMSGAWLAAAAYLPLLSGLLYLRYRRGRWMERNIFRDQEPCRGQGPAR